MLQLFSGLSGCLDASEIFIALARAWMVTIIATALLCIALAVAQVWDRAIYMDGLRDALSRDPQMAQPLDGMWTNELHPSLPGSATYRAF